MAADAAAATRKILKTPGHPRFMRKSPVYCPSVRVRSESEPNSGCYVFRGVRYKVPGIEFLKQSSQRGSLRNDRKSKHGLASIIHAQQLFVINRENFRKKAVFTRARNFITRFLLVNTRQPRIYYTRPLRSFELTMKAHLNSRLEKLSSWVGPTRVHAWVAQKTHVDSF